MGGRGQEAEAAPGKTRIPPRDDGATKATWREYARYSVLEGVIEASGGVGLRTNRAKMKKSSSGALVWLAA